MIIALCCCGTWGDVAPFLEIGSALQARGGQVAILAPASYAEQAAQRQLPLIPTLTRQQMQDWLQHPSMWHRRKFFTPLLEKLMAPSIAPIVDWVCSQNHRELLVVSDYSSSPAARLACLRSGARHLTAWRDAAGLRSRSHPSILSGADFLTTGWPSRLLREAIFLSTDLLAWWKLGPEMARYHFRPPLRLLDWMVSPQGSLALFPDWFAAPPPDWPAGIQCLGFPRPLQSAPLPPHLEDFLQAGPPPLVATLGSAVQGVQADLLCLIQEVHRRNQRLVLLGPQLNGLPRHKNLLAAGFVPLAPLLQRARAFLHHGGIGTCAEALAAGLPQLVMPLAHDQFDNARRLVQLGAARCLPRHQLNPSRLGKHLDLLNQPRQPRLDPPERVLERICQVLEKQAARN